MLFNSRRSGILRRAAISGRFAIFGRRMTAAGRAGTGVLSPALKRRQMVTGQRLDCRHGALPAQRLPEMLQYFRMVKNQRRGQVVQRIKSRVGRVIPCHDGFGITRPARVYHRKRMLARVALGARVYAKKARQFHIQPGFFAHFAHGGGLGLFALVNKASRQGKTQRGVLATNNNHSPARFVNDHVGSGRRIAKTGIGLAAMRADDFFLHADLRLAYRTAQAAGTGILSQHAPGRKSGQRRGPCLDNNVWLPYTTSMHDKIPRKTEVELRIHEAVLNDLADPAIQRLRNNHICFTLLSLVTRFYALERQCRNFGTDVPIHLGEIQMIMTIHNAEGIHVGGLAKKLGITKGSVSEMLRKLERKGLIRKEKDPLKMTRLNVYLTDKGKTAHASHMYYHSRLDNVVAEAAAGHDAAAVENFAHFLDDILARLTAFSKS